MDEFWASFLFHFCKVDFVCWNGAPNWLGWALIAAAGFVLLLLSIPIWIGMVHFLFGKEMWFPEPREREKPFWQRPLGFWPGVLLSYGLLGLVLYVVVRCCQ